MSYVLNTEVPTQTIFLDSVNSTTIMVQDANGNCYSDYTWFFTQPVMCQPNHRMLVSVIDAQFPNVFPQIVTNYNNKFIYNVSGTTLTLTLPSKHYTIDTLASYISANTILSVSVDYITYKLTFTTTGESFSILGTSTCADVIGLSRSMFGGYETSSSFANTLTMPNCFNLSGTPYVFLNVRNFIIGSIDSGSNDGVMTRMDINAPFGSVCFFRPPTIEQHLVGTRSLNSIRVFLTDHNGYALCLGNQNIQLTLRIQFIQDPRLDPDYVGQSLGLDIKAYKDMKPYDIPIENYGNQGEPFGDA
jgi:hypothetical protein